MIGNKRCPLFASFDFNWNNIFLYLHFLFYDMICLFMSFGLFIYWDCGVFLIGSSIFYIGNILDHCLLIFFWDRVCYLAQAGLELTVSCFSILSAGITSMSHYAWFLLTFRVIPSHLSGILGWLLKSPELYLNLF